MRGGVKWQVKEIFLRSGINKRGVSKHKDKAIARNICKMNGIPTTPKNIAKHLGIYSIQTATTYMDSWKSLFNHAKADDGLRDLTKKEPTHVQNYLEWKIESGVTLKSFRTYAAACEKLAIALEGYSKKINKPQRYDFAGVIHDCQRTAAHILNSRKVSRAYESPRSIIRKLEVPAHRLAAAIQLQSGARVNDILSIKPHQLNGIERDPVTGDPKGKIWIEKSKGGKSGEVRVNTTTYVWLKEVINNGRYGINLKEYRADLRLAAKLSSQTYQGTHGLRWAFAQIRFREIQEKENISYKKALSIVSREMFHKRENITKHYLT